MQENSNDYKFCIKVALDHAKKSLTSQSSHPGDLSLQFFSTPTRLQKRLSNYPTSPPVIKAIFGINKKKTQEAQNLYHKGLQNQKNLSLSQRVTQQLQPKAYMLI